MTVRELLAHEPNQETPKELAMLCAFPRKPLALKPVNYDRDRQKTVRETVVATICDR